MGPSIAHVMTLANSIIGVSILAMPYCFKQCGIILSILMLVLSGVITRLCCHFLVKSASISRRRTYEFLAFHTFGPTGKLAVELSIIGFLLGTCVAFFVVMGDLGPDILTKSFGLQHSEHMRTSVLIGLSVLVVLPLGLLRNVDSLSTVCTASILFYLCLVLKVMSEATPHLLAGDWWDHVNLWRPAGILQCIPIFSMALACQTQVFEIYEALPEASLTRMNEVVRAAVNICTGVYICVGFFGYIAFCTQNFSGNVLMSFSPSLTTDVMKLGFVLSVAVSFPLVIFPCRASLYSLLFRRVSSWHPELVGGPVHIPEGRFKCLTVFLVGVALIVGLLLPNIELVLGLVGSTIGTIICLLLPALVFTRLASKYSSERLVAQVIFFIAAGILILSTYANLYAADKANSGEHEGPNSLLSLDKPLLVDNKLPEPEVVLGKGVIGGIDSDKKLKDALADIIEHDKKKKENEKSLPLNVVVEKPKNQNEVLKKVEPLPRDSKSIGGKNIIESPPPALKKYEDISPKVEIPRIEVPNVDVPAPVIPQKPVDNILIKHGDQVAPDAIRKDVQERAEEEDKQPVASPAAPVVRPNGGDQEQKLLAKLAKHKETQQQILQEQKQILQELKQQKQEDQQQRQQDKLGENIAVQDLAPKEAKIAPEAKAKLPIDKIDTLGKNSVVLEETERKEKIKKEAAPLVIQPLIQKLADKVPVAPMESAKHVDTNKIEDKETPVMEQKLKNIASDLQKLTNELVLLNTAPKLNPNVVAPKAQPIGALLTSNQQQQKQLQDNVDKSQVQPVLSENENKKVETKIKKTEDNHPRVKREAETHLNETCIQNSANHGSQENADPSENVDLVDKQKTETSHRLALSEDKMLDPEKIKQINYLSPPEIKLSNPELSPGQSEGEILLGKPMSRDLRSIENRDEQ